MKSPTPATPKRTRAVKLLYPIWKNYRQYYKVPDKVRWQSVSMPHFSHVVDAAARANGFSVEDPVVVPLDPNATPDNDPGGVLIRSLDHLLASQAKARGVAECLHIQTIDGVHSCISGEDEEAKRSFSKMLDTVCKIRPKVVVLEEIFKLREVLAVTSSHGFRPESYTSMLAS